MAASDYGIIVIKNGELFDKKSEMGCSYKLNINDRIDYAYKLNFNGLILPDVMESPYRQAFQCLFDNYGTKCVLPTDYMSRRFMVNGVLVHIKNRDHNVYEITFAMDGDRYAVLMGVDVSFRYFWRKATKKKVSRFLSKHLTSRKEKR